MMMCVSSIVTIQGKNIRRTFGLDVDILNDMALTTTHIAKCMKFLCKYTVYQCTFMYSFS